MKNDLTVSKFPWAKVWKDKQSLPLVILYDLLYVEMMAMSNSNPVVMQCQIAPLPPYLSRVHTRHIAYMCLRPVISPLYVKYKFLGMGTIL